MKTIHYLVFILIGISITFSLPAQVQEKVTPVDITFNKTSTIVFPTVIKSVDRGSRDVLAQKTREVGNVLQLKAARKDFPETNLTVITADGVLHEFIINYCEEPSRLVVDMSANASEGDRTPSRMIFSTDMTEADLGEYSQGILRSKRILHFRNTSKYKISLSLLGIYIKENVIFYRMRIGNHSNINYDIDFLRFYIRDNARIKRTASQEVESRPLYVEGAVSTIKGRSEAEMVFALEKFTIPESKHLAVELFERKGGRHFQLRIKNKEIVNARLLP
ncbi:MAG: conjugative transposon protein TraN [Cyclobacteriaceae bacterium]|nr:conjugative transposon protein TraN [Cyclobacteriaceae bacterium]